MIIGVMSDTHGHVTEMRRAVTRMLEEFHADVIVHLGDDSTDADELLGMDVEVITVPGIFEKRYHSKDVPNRLIKEFDNIPFLLTHTPTKNEHDSPDELDPTALTQDGDVKVVLYGHTHKPDISEKHGAYYINPGHLNPRDNRGSDLTFAILVLKEKRLSVKIVSLNGPILEEKMFFM